MTEAKKDGKLNTIKRDAIWKTVAKTEDDERSKLLKNMARLRELRLAKEAEAKEAKAKLGDRK